jgi:rubrerythrin
LGDNRHSKKKEYNMPRQWKCTVCGYIHEGKNPPDQCPVCEAFKYQFILYEDLPGELEKRLREAFAGESKAYIRNTAFAKQADQEGYPQIARLFRAVAEAEKVHAEEYLKYLEGVVKDTESNLKVIWGRTRPIPLNIKINIPF